MSVTGEREGGVAGRRKPKEKVHSCEGAMGPARPAGEAAAREGEWANAATWAEWARMKEEFKIRFDFQISINFWNLARL
jgi:hypothetical protein